MRLKTIVLLWIVSCLLATTVSAQTILLHGHPQKASYASPAEWPPIEPQGHWLQGGEPLMHLHLVTWCPIYGELSQPFTCNFQIKMFRWNGVLPTFPVWGQHVSNVVFDDTGTASPKITVGDPDALIVQSGRVTIDPRLDRGWGAWPVHGWAGTFVAFDGLLNDGTAIEVQNELAFWSMVDPTVAPYSNMEGGFIIVGSKIQNKPSSGSALGATVMEFLSYLPLAPIDKPFPVSFRTYSYGMDFSPETVAFPNLTEISLDANLHMGNEGTQIFTQTGTGIGGVFFYFGQPCCSVDHLYYIDPAQIGSGTHNLLFRWKVDTGAGSAHFTAGEQIWALLTIPVTVGDGVPAPSPPPSDPCVTDPVMPIVDVSAMPPHVVTGWTGTITAIDERGCTGTVSR